MIERLTPLLAVALLVASTAAAQDLSRYSEDGLRA